MHFLTVEIETLICISLYFYYMYWLYSVHTTNFDYIPILAGLLYPELPVFFPVQCIFYINMILYTYGELSLCYKEMREKNCNRMFYQNVQNSNIDVWYSL